MRSLRLQLLTRTTSVVVAALLLAALALYWLMRMSLLTAFDAALLVETRSLISHVELSEEDVSVELDLALSPEFSRVQKPHFFQIWTRDGITVARSPSLFDSSLNARLTDVSEPIFAFVRLPSDAAGREVTLCFQPRHEGLEEVEEYADEALSRKMSPLTITVARPIAEFEQTLSTLRWLLLIVTVVAALGVAAMMNGVIRRGLRSLEMLAHSIERVGVTDLSERICLESSPQEVLPVVQRLNELLVRLDNAMAREKTFSADVAHELRTPLAGLETTLEVCASRRRDPDAYHDVVSKCLRVTQGMHVMVNNLLTLARADSDALSVETEATDVALFLKECWQSFDLLATQRGLSVEWTMSNAAPVLLDREKLRLILSNLFDNAVSYSNEGGWMRVMAEISETLLSIRISNSGCSLKPDELPHIFQRFWRCDTSRSDTGTHSGLGLALCHRIVNILSGTIAAQVQEGTFTISVLIPTCPLL